MTKQLKEMEEMKALIAAIAKMIGIYADCIYDLLYDS